MRCGNNTRGSAYRATHAAQVLTGSWTSRLPPQKITRGVTEYIEALERFAFPETIGGTPLKYTDDFGNATTRDNMKLPVTALANLLRRVAFLSPDVLDPFLSMVEEEMALIAPNERLILCVERSIGIKSTKMLALYLLQHLKNSQIEGSRVLLNRIDMKESSHITVEEVEKSHIVVVDDMSFSGTQLIDNHSGMINVTFFTMGMTEDGKRRILDHARKEGFKWTCHTSVTIPVVPDDEYKTIYKYIDIGSPERGNASAAATLFASWKLPDSLSTFDNFIKGKVYLGHVIENHNEFESSDVLWYKVIDTPIVDPETWYKRDPNLACLWDQAFTRNNIALIERYNESESMEFEYEPCKRQRTSSLFLVTYRDDYIVFKRTNRTDKIKCLSIVTGKQSEKEERDSTPVATILNKVASISITVDMLRDGSASYQVASVTTPSVSKTTDLELLNMFHRAIVNVCEKDSVLCTALKNMKNRYLYDTYEYKIQSKPGIEFYTRIVTLNQNYQIFNLESPTAF